MNEITPGRLKILMAILATVQAKGRAVSLREVGQTLGQSGYNVWVRGVVDELERAGLVRRERSANGHARHCTIMPACRFERRS